MRSDIDRVAKAICEAFESELEAGPSRFRRGWDEQIDLSRASYRRDARAAIAALREPTEAMASAGRNELVGCMRGNFPLEAYRGLCRDIWISMINALLAEDGQ